MALTSHDEIMSQIQEEGARRRRVLPFVHQYERGIITTEELISKLFQYFDKP